jgi:hypothetical protein
MVPQLDRTNLFIWARDWTGITSGGNQTPEWWFWKFYHRVDLSDTNLDVVGNPLLYDYTNGIAPAILAITVTNASVVSKPMITVQGYANGPLKNLTFDVNNAAGVVTDQQGYWQAAVYNTNLWQFTTNLFACYDIALASGLNTVVLHATDLGGNMVSTNFSVILDYSADTPPSLTLVWPPDGAAIAGSDFTMQAQTDDNTAVVQATVVDSDGNTNTTGGVVERNGTVWVNHLPLGAGENVVTATVMDAAGNSNSISETVYRSAVTVTMYPLTPDNLNQEWVNVSGTISDPGYEVWINGVQATVNADGNWYIDDDSVQVSPTGTAIFDVSARAASGSGMAIRALAMNGSSSLTTCSNFPKRNHLW